MLHPGWVKNIIRQPILELCSDSEATTIVRILSVLILCRLKRFLLAQIMVKTDLTPFKYREPQTHCRQACHWTTRFSNSTIPGEIGLMTTPTKPKHWTCSWDYQN